MQAYWVYILDSVKGETDFGVMAGGESSAITIGMREAKKQGYLHINRVETERA